ncbi:MAG: hypothetical protein QM784_13375 [Polyangiaceae bacterium]
MTISPIAAALPLALGLVVCGCSDGASSASNSGAGGAGGSSSGTSSGGAWSNETFDTLPDRCNGQCNAFTAAESDS